MMHWLDAEELLKYFIIHKLQLLLLIDTLFVCLLIVCVYVMQ